MYLLAELLSAYPNYCPLEVLLSAQTNESVERCRGRVNQALEQGTVEKVMRGVRSLLVQCRPKLRTFGLDARPHGNRLYPHCYHPMMILRSAVPTCLSRERWEHTSTALVVALAPTAQLARASRKGV